MSLEHLSLTNYMTLYKVCIWSLEAVEYIINSNSANGGKYSNYVQLCTKKTKRRKREIANTSSNNKCPIIDLW